MLIFAMFVIIQGQPCPIVSLDNFPDADYVTTVENVRFGSFGSNCDIWDCKQDTSGERCTEECYTTQDPGISCDTGERWQVCDAPLLQMCVSCQQNGAMGTFETPGGGYSFSAYTTAVEVYDLLNRRGSFEYAKLYPTSPNSVGGRFMTTRPAVENLPPVGVLWQDTPPIPWNDVMFPGNGNIRWDGVGTMKLINGEGALHSNVFLEMSAPYSKLLAVGIETNDDIQRALYNQQPDNFDTSVSVGEFNHIRGLVYEFQYRQRVFTTSPDIIVTAALATAGLDGGVVTVTPRIQATESLPSRSSWNRHVGMLDYAEDNTPPAPADACLCLEFETAVGKDVLVDDVRVFANLFGNGRFTKAGSWVRSCAGITQCEPNQNDWIDDENFFVRLGVTDSIDQRVHMRVDPGLVAHKETATFVMDVRGSGLLLVTSYLNGQSDSILHFRKNVVNGEEGIWHTITFQVVLHVETPLSRNPIFRIENAEETETSVLYVDNVIMYVDPRGCNHSTFQNLNNDDEIRMCPSIGKLTKI